MNFIVKIILNGLVLLGIDYFVDSITLTGFGAAVIAVIVLSLVNTIVKPILTLLTLPITFLTLGLFLFVINGITFYLTSLVVTGFEVDGIMGAIVGSILMSIFSTIISGKK